MAQLSQVEVNAIREVVTGHQAMASKFSTYSSQCQDSQIKQMFQKAATDARDSAQKLISML